ncbi:MAG: hypothetical protein R3B70_25825 [Polyangiaceae bacterium]
MPRWMTGVAVASGGGLAALSLAVHGVWIGLGMWYPVETPHAISYRPYYELRPVGGMAVDSRGRARGVRAGGADISDRWPGVATIAAMGDGAESAAKRVGSTFAGKYRIVQLLRGGGIANVFLADHVTGRSEPPCFLRWKKGKRSRDWWWLRRREIDAARGAELARAGGLRGWR